MKNDILKNTITVKNYFSTGHAPITYRVQLELAGYNTYTRFYRVHEE